jgi:hypothetical protein
MSNYAAKIDSLDVACFVVGQTAQATRATAQVTPETLTDEMIRSRIRQIESDPVRFSRRSDLLLEECRVAMEAPLGSMRRMTARAAIADAINARTQPARDLTVTGGNVGIRTSELTEPVRIRTLQVSGKGSIGIDLDDERKR